MCLLEMYHLHRSVCQIKFVLLLTYSGDIRSFFCVKAADKYTLLLRCFKWLNTRAVSSSGPTS